MMEDSFFQTVAVHYIQVAAACRIFKQVFAKLKNLMNIPRNFDFRNHLIFEGRRESALWGLLRQE